MLTHDEYVAAGYCPAMIDVNYRSQTRGRPRIPHVTWCMLKAGHRSEHQTLSIAPAIKAEYVHWSDNNPGVVHADSSERTIDT